jgi:hypothetical protein
MNHSLHLALVFLTAGLWLVSWIALCIGKLVHPWRCEHCGWHKPEFLKEQKPRPPVAASVTPKPIRRERDRVAPNGRVVAAGSQRLSTQP